MTTSTTDEQVRHCLAQAALLERCAVNAEKIRCPNAAASYRRKADLLRQEAERLAAVEQGR